MPTTQANAPTSSGQDLFTRAVQAHTAGDLASAEKHYRQVIRKSPRHAEALNNLGAILAGRGARDEARTVLTLAVEVDANYGEALNNLGLLASEDADPVTAAGCFGRAVAIDPAKHDWLNNLGNALVDLQRFAEALDAYDRAVAMRGDVANYWSNRGIALRGLRRPADAVASFERALALDPCHVNALSNMGVLYKEEKAFPPAIAAFERAIELQPGNAALIANFATVFEMTGDLQRMRELAQRAIEIDPSYAESYNLLANHELESARYDAAESLYREALRRDPGNRNANWNLAIIWLLRGDFERGWRQFEWRRRLQSVVVDVTDCAGPEWDGSPLDGRTILLVTEQGIGDAVQFIRYARDLKRMGAGRVIVECPYPIAPLLDGVPGVDQAVARGTPLPAYDTWANLMSLPALMQTTLATIPADVPYILPEPRPAAGAITTEAGTIKVGIVWAGNPVHKRDFLRSAELSRFARLLDIPGTQFYSLQKGDDGERQLRELDDARIIDLAPHLTDLRDTAAVIDRLDLVIAVDTSVAHLAGAMGKPTWVLLPHVPDFRWMLDRPDSPWYPTMRLFRQAEPRRWDDVFDTVESELRRLTTTSQDPSIETTMPPSTGPLVTTLEAAMRFPDGRPRFDVWIPLARLADPSWFAEYEAELVHGGHHRKLRAFWDEAAHAVDAFIDLTPGIGLSVLSMLTAPRPVRRIIAVERNPEDAERLESIVATRSRGHTASVVAGAADAIEAAQREGIRRIGVHGGDAEALRDFARAWKRAGARPEVDVITCAAQGMPDEVTWRSAPEWDGLLPLAVDLVDGEVNLDTLTGDHGDVDVAWLSGTALELLGNAHVDAPGSVEATMAFAPLATSFSTADTARSIGEGGVGIDWELRSDTGWGVYGTNLALELLRRGSAPPGIFAVDEDALSPVAAWRLRDILQATARDRDAVRLPHVAPTVWNGLMLRGLGNNLATSALWDRVRGNRNAGIIFFEDTSFDASARERARSLDVIIAGSTWNAEVLRSSGFTGVRCVQQGIDPTIFHPAPRSGLLEDRFVVFSGGKLEYRKGQDIVVAAFRRFRERHPEALLVTAWHNAWPQLISDLDLAGHVRGAPRFNSEGLLVTEWLAGNDVPPGSVLDIGRTPNALMGAVVREADVALFPNRCEGGTNLVAMECMAAGVPTIISANTGHLDLVATGGCISLDQQAPIRPPTRFFRATEGWGESSVDEIVEVLEKLYTDRQAARQVAARGVQVMQDWTWAKQIDRLLKTLSPLLDQPAS